MSTNLYLGFIASLYGIGGVFAVLILFYLMTKVLMKIFSKESKAEVNHFEEAA